MEPVRDGNALALEMFRFAGLSALLVALSVLPAVSQERERGALIAAGGGPGGPRSACFTCHGIDGGGQAAGGIPALAGLDADYLARQLDDYASQARPDPAMRDIARALGPADRRAVSTYYAQLTRSTPIALRHDPAHLQEGAALYAIGSTRVQACIDCHGPLARGTNAAPALAAQPAPYTATQLRLWQEGRRRNDPDGVMARVAQAMSAREIEAVAAYLASLGPAAE
jgi:cytochrome c553